MIWTLKTFYWFSQVDYPLIIHDGGLTGNQAANLNRHFPDATIVALREGDRQITAYLTSRRLWRCLEFRLRNPFGRKLFDFFVFSEAKRVISLDSDILFFREPRRLLTLPERPRRNIFNRDCGYWYCMSLDELQARFGLRPPPRINAGLSSIWCESLNLPLIEQWLAEPGLHNEPWLTEQTLHALSSTLYGVELLPDSYALGPTKVPIEARVCHHYPSGFRQWLYEEGMVYLIERGFINSLADMRSCRAA